MSGDDPVVGKLGIVTHRIVPGRAGEIVVHIRGGTETFMAYAETELAEQTEVLVIAKRSARTVEVTPFTG